MNGGTAMEKLGLGPEVRELKFGQSFAGKGGSFHTVRYDFKPASVDSTKMATLDVGTNNQVTISIPHSDGASTNVFKGARKPYTKECVLIVDHVTGEVTLEKLTHTIQVKKTRPERPEGAPRGSQKPPPAPSDVKKPLPPTSLSISHGSSSASASDRPISKSSKDNKIKKLMPFGGASHSPSNPAPHRGSNSPMTSVPPRHSPLGPSPGHLSPGNGNSQSASSAFDALSKKHQKPQASAMPSLPCIEDLLSFGESTPAPPPPAPSYVAKPPPPPAPPVNQNRAPHHSHSQSQNPIRLQPPAPAPSKSPVAPTIAHVAPTTVLSDSSSGDSSSSSSSEASDDESSDGDMEVVPDERGRASPPAPSMPSVFDNMPIPGAVTRPIMTKPIAAASTSHLLSEDLQLSESGSDSDSD